MIEAEATNRQSGQRPATACAGLPSVAWRRVRPRLHRGAGHAELAWLRNASETTVRSTSTRSKTASLFAARRLWPVSGLRSVGPTAKDTKRTTACAGHPAARDVRKKRSCVHPRADARQPRAGAFFLFYQPEAPARVLRT